MAKRITWTARDKSKVAELAPQVVSAMDRIKRANLYADRLIRKMDRQFPEAKNFWGDFVLEPLNQAELDPEIRSNPEAVSDMSAAIRDFVLSFRAAEDDQPATAVGGVASE